MLDLSRVSRQPKANIGQLFQSVYGVNTPWQKAARPRNFAKVAGAIANQTHNKNHHYEKQNISHHIPFHRRHGGGLQ
jgi:hypothetical protein